MRRGVCLLALAVAALGQTAGYRVSGKIQVGGEGGWDYLTVDSEARRLYVSHATHVSVVDIDGLKLAGDIPDTPGVHGIALAPKLKRGFISNGRGNNITIFDLESLKSLGQVKTGENPDAIFYDEGSNRVFTFNGRSKDATVIDAAAGKALATIPLGGKPEFAAGDSKGKVYVNIEDTAEIAVIDPAKAAVEKRYKLTGCEEPSGLAIDRAKTRLFSVCGNKVMIVSDPTKGSVIATLPIGQGPDGAAFDQERGLAFSSNGEGTLTVVGEKDGKYAVLGTVPTQRGARIVAMDPKTHKLYLPTAQFGPAPAATAEMPRPRPPTLPGSFVVLIVSR